MIQRILCAGLLAVLLAAACGDKPDSPPPQVIPWKQYPECKGGLIVDQAACGILIEERKQTELLQAILDELRK